MVVADDILLSIPHLAPDSLAGQPFLEANI